MVNAKKVVPAGNNLEISGLTGDDQGNRTTIEKDAPKRNRPLLNIIRHSLGADEDGVKRQPPQPEPLASTVSARRSAI